MSKPKRPIGRPPRELGRDLLFPVLDSLRDGPKMVREIKVDNLTNYLMDRIADRGLVSKVIKKVSTGPGRPNKTFELTEQGREWLDGQP